MNRLYWTKIKGDDENKVFGNNAYVRGRISGFMEVLCGRSASPTYFEAKNGSAHMGVRCTEEQYRAFRELVEKRYPELCEFDVEFEV